MALVSQGSAVRWDGAAVIEAGAGWRLLRHTAPLSLCSHYSQRLNELSEGIRQTLKYCLQSRCLQPGQHGAASCSSDPGEREVTLSALMFYLPTCQVRGKELGGIA